MTSGEKAFRLQPRGPHTSKKEPRRHAVVLEQGSHREACEERSLLSQNVSTGGVLALASLGSASYRGNALLPVCTTRGRTEWETLCLCEGA